MSKSIVIIGGGVIGLCTAYYCARRGFKVTVVERKPEQRDGCSFGNAGMVVPSHFVPLAAPGAVSLALKWMWNPASPFYIQPRLDADLLRWGFKFWRAATWKHVRRSMPLLRDLALASRKCFEDCAAEPDNDFGLIKKGLLMLCQKQHTLDEEAKTRGTSSRARNPRRRFWTRNRPPRLIPARCSISPAQFIFHWTVISRRRVSWPCFRRDWKRSA